MIVEHLGDGAYATIDRDFAGQVILTANHHDVNLASDIVHLEASGVELLLTLIKRSQEEHNG